jgi:hypothetical protein
MILGFITPNNGFLPLDFVKSLLSLQGKYEITYAEGPDIPSNRNKVFNYAKKRGQSFLCLDSDMTFTLEDVQKIEKHLETYDAISGLYVLGRPPYPPAIWERAEGDYKPMQPKEGIFEIGTSGGGFLAMSSKVVQALDNPFNHFIEGTIEHGEEQSACHRIHLAGFKLWCDADIKLGHLRTKPIYYGER